MCGRRTLRPCFPSSTLGERELARKHISRKMSSGDHFRSLCASCCCAKCLPFYLLGRQLFGFVYIDSHHYGILHPMSKITRNGASQEFSPFVSSRRMRLFTNVAICFSQLFLSKFRSCIYNSKLRNSVRVYRRGGEKISVIDVFIVYDTIA